MLVVKLLVLVFSPILLVIGGVWLIGTTLTVDDLRDCSTSPIAEQSECRPADAIIAISGGDTSARTQEAIKLYQQGWAPQLVLSGAALDKSGLSNAAAMQQQALRAGVPQAAIILDEQAADTAGNAAGLKPIVDHYGIKRVILVTSPYHQRRASLEFARTLGEDIEISNHPTPDDRYWEPEKWWLHPYSWYLALSELVKLIYVTITGK